MTEVSTRMVSVWLASCEENNKLQPVSTYFDESTAFAPVVLCYAEPHLFKNNNQSNETINMSNTAIPLANRLEIFVDHHLIERLAGVAHHMHRPVPAETVFKFDKPWEGNVCGYSTLLHDGEKYRLYYRGWNIPEGQTDKDVTPYYCVAYSNDGLSFTRPNLGLVKYKGSTDNNIILEGSSFHSFAPFIDTRPGTPHNERFKAITTTSGSKQHELVAYGSSDGLTWKPIRDEPIIDRTHAAFDSMNLAFWSEHENCYVCYSRTWSNPRPDSHYGGKRTISRFTSTNFMDWQGPFNMQFSGTPMEELYTNSTLPYPRAPHIYMAFPKRFVIGASPLTQEQAVALDILTSQRGNVSDGVFMTSRGGDQYDRLFMEAFVPPGRDQGNWAARSLMSVWGLAQTADDEISLYYQQRYGLPTASIKRYTLRTDGFISIRAPWQGGEFTTKPITFTGKQLKLNFATSAAGSIKVEIQNPSGVPFDGFTLNDAVAMTGDLLDQPAQWGEKISPRTDVSSLVGKEVRLRFVMRDADLYAMQFES